MGGNSQIELRFAPWDDTARAHCAKTPNAPLGYYAAEIAAKRLTVLGVFFGPARLGTVLYRVESDELGSTFVPVCVQARSIVGFDWVRSVWPAMEGYARRLGCDRVRAHPLRLGMVRKLSAQGFDLGEAIMTKAIA